MTPDDSAGHAPTRHNGGLRLEFSQSSLHVCPATHARCTAHALSAPIPASALMNSLCVLRHENCGAVFHACFF